MRILAAAVLVIAAPSAFAQNVMVWSTGNSTTNTSNIADWLLNLGGFTTVDSLNADAINQNLLNSYDAVLYFSNESQTQNPANVGNQLANYATTTGNRLVIATFGLADQGNNTLGGAIVDLMPLNFDGGSLYSDATLDSTDGSDFWTGVTGVTGRYRDNVNLVRGQSHGTWSDGEILLASNGEIVNVNLFPDDSFGSVSGDHRQLFVNALSAPVPEPATMIALGAGLAALASRRRKKA